ncbi:MAG: HepT-like ribonuclease domain-containing protein [Methanospirillum sp.]
MRQRDARAYLYDILAACARIAEFTAGRTIEDYRQDAMVRSAVERQFEIVGEALNLLRQSDPCTAGRITDASRIIAFRNRLIHGYATVSDDVVWGVIEASLPVLAREADCLMREFETPDDP